MSGWLASFIVIAAVAIVVQMAILLAMFLQVRTAIRNFTRLAADLQARVDPILVRANRILENSEDRIASIMTDASELTRITRNQAQKVDRVFTEAVERLRLQIVRADQIVTGTIEVVEEAGSTFRRRLWDPLNQASAMIKGIKAGLDFIRGPKRRTNSGEAAAQDEELFI